MKVLTDACPTGERILALGTFDGVHLGHEKLLRTAAEKAKEIGIPLRACTFDRHPLALVAPERAPGLLTTAEEKAERMAALGADELRIMAFTREMMDRTPEDFLALLRHECVVCGIAVGWNYTFGRGGRGTPEMLEADGKRNGYAVTVLEPVKTAGGVAISSTGIRECLLQGDLEGAAEMLGRPYTLTGPVEGGKHVGRRLGFPTANVRPAAEKQLPAYGVYLCRARDADREYRAAVNIGVQPTLPSGRVTVEAHFLEETPDLYGHTVSLSLLTRLRPERRFDGPEELREQIRKDLEAARSFFGMA